MNHHNAISMPTVLIHWVPMTVSVGKVFLEMVLFVLVSSIRVGHIHFRFSCSVIINVYT